jgi:HAMP domain-containing protein
LIVNKIAEINAELPGVAYVSVLNDKGTIIAGIFGDKKRFDSNFIKKVDESGFPREISTQNRIPVDKNESALDYLIGGKKIHDVAVKIGATGGEAHVGLFIEDTENEESTARKSLTPFLLSLASISALGCLCFFLVARSISIPIQSLTQAAEKMSLGEIDLPIKVKGSGEIRELATSLERMRFSVNTALNRLQRKTSVETFTK